MFEVAHHGATAAQLRGPPVSLVVVADGAVANHSQNIREDPLVVKEEREMSQFKPFRLPKKIFENDFATLTESASISGEIHAEFDIFNY